MELKKVLALFGNFSGKRNDLIISVSDYLESVLKKSRKLCKLWKKVEKELMAEGIFQKGGHMDIKEHIKEKAMIKGVQKGIRKGRIEGVQKGRIEGVRKGRIEGVQKGRIEGVQKGRIEGIQKGRIEGVQKGRQEVILKMLKEKVDIAFISKVTGLSEKEIKKLKNDF